MRAPSTDAGALARCAAFQTLKPQASLPSHSRTKPRRVDDAGTRESKAPAANAAGGRLSAGSYKSIGF